MYTVDYFINKFSNTLDNLWCVGTLLNSENQSCANGWCGVRIVDGDFAPTKESISLKHLFHCLSTDKNHDNVRFPLYSDIAATINNGEDERYRQPTPKERILAALYDIKKMQEPHPEPIKEKIRYVSVPTSITEQAKELTTILS